MISFSQNLNSQNAYFKVKMIYNNLGKSDGLKAKWGLGMWIETENEAILFDTGGEEKTIWDNIVAANLNTDKLKAIVISHYHWDHINGLEHVLKNTDLNLIVYVPQSELNNFTKKFPDANFKGIENATEIFPNISLSGVTSITFNDGSSIYELSLLLKKDEKIYLLTGCSHSKIERIVEYVKQIKPDHSIEFIAGGFHLRKASADEVLKISNELKKLGVKTLAPSHCTGEQAIEVFKKEWGDDFVEFYLGDEIEI